MTNTKKILVCILCVVCLSSVLLTVCGASGFTENADGYVNFVPYQVNLYYPGDAYMASCVFGTFDTNAFNSYVVDAPIWYFYGDGLLPDMTPHGDGLVCHYGAYTGMDVVLTDVALSYDGFVSTFPDMVFSMFDAYSYTGDYADEEGHSTFLYFRPVFTGLISYVDVDGDVQFVPISENGQAFMNYRDNTGVEPTGSMRSLFSPMNNSGARDAIEAFFARYIDADDVYYIDSVLLNVQFEGTISYIINDYTNWVSGDAIIEGCLGGAQTSTYVSSNSFEPIIKHHWNEVGSDDWFGWLGNALTGVFDAPLFNVEVFGNTIPFTIGAMFFAILSVFGIFALLRAFAGG